VRYCFRLFVMILAVAAVLSSCKEDMPPDIVAKIDDDVITVAEFTAEFFPLVKGYSPSPSSQVNEALRTLKEALLDQLIEKRLILREATAMGITVSEEELEETLTLIQRSYPEGGFEEVVKDEASLLRWKERLRQRILIEKAINRVSQLATPIDEKAMQKYYEQHREQFAVAEQVRVRQIVLGDRTQAEDVLRKLKRGEAFDELAKRYSSAPEAEDGGDLGFFGRGEMPQEFDVVFSLEAGEISDIVQSPYGYHIFQVMAKRGHSESSFAEVQTQVRQMMMREREEQAFQDWLHSVKKKADIRVNEEALEGIGLPAPQTEENKETQ
jgi:parvulin-like peptidyl-prolyl isomerase